MEKLPKFIEKIKNIVEESFKKIKDEKERGGYLQDLFQNKFPKKEFYFGSSRFCFFYRNRCYKFAYNKAGFEQNNKEYNVYFNIEDKYRKYITKIYRTHYFFNVHEIVNEEEDLSISYYICSYLEQNFGLYTPDLQEQIGINNKGEIKIFDYGFDKNVYKKYYAS